MRTKKFFFHHILFLSVLSGFLALSGCGVYADISISSDNTVDFSRYKTFAWLPDKTDTGNSPYNNEIIRNNLRNYFGQEMTIRGYAVELDTPDVLLQVAIVTKRQKKEIHYRAYPRSFYYCNYYYCSVYYSPYPNNYYYRYSNDYCYGMGYCKESIEYVEGSITLNVIDRRANKLLWSGTAKGDIYDPAYVNRSIHPAVVRIMKKFPVHMIERRVTDEIYK